MKKGFTLIELLVVISIIAILATVVFVALNPSKRFTDARNARRFDDVNNILTAVHQCIVDNGGTIATCVGTLTAGSTYEVVDTGIVTGCQTSCPGATAESSCAALQAPLASYLKSLPLDPAGGLTTGHTRYSITRDTNNLFTIANCTTEGAAVSVSR